MHTPDNRSVSRVAFPPSPKTKMVYDEVKQRRREEHKNNSYYFRIMNMQRELTELGQFCILQLSLDSLQYSGHLHF